jgi:hypothetical protein
MIDTFPQAINRLQRHDLQLSVNFDATSRRRHLGGGIFASQCNTAYVLKPTVAAAVAASKELLCISSFETSDSCS